MTSSFTRKSALTVAGFLIAGAMSGTNAQARDFFSSFFGAMGNRSSAAPSAPLALPFAEFGDTNTQLQQPRVASSAYCVRSCDGRYFPITGSGTQSKAETCKSFCPASETKVVYGSNIDNAYTDGGKSYADLPNAFRYRTELVSGCTCNGKDPGGLARVNIENDPTVRRGDIVAGPNGLSTTSRTSEKRGASLNYSPVSAQSVRSQFKQLPVVASQ
jgi:Protein of unknown function (DUF2865)